MTCQPEHSQDIILRICKNNPSLQELMSQLQPAALTEVERQLPAQLPTEEILVLDCFVTLHIPAKKYKRAKKPVQQMIEPFGGFYSLPVLGGWRNEKKVWDIENIRLVTSYTSFNALRQEFLKILIGSYHLGRYLQESAIGLQIGIPMQTWMLIIPTKG